MSPASLSITAIALLIAACATVSKPMRVGADTYMITGESGTAVESAVEIKTTAIQKANAFCEERGLVMKLVSVQSVDGIPGRSVATVELVFMALLPDDPRNTSPDLRPVPDTVIEVR